jgi:hypothetical protein
LWDSGVFFSRKGAKGAKGFFAKERRLWDSGVFFSRKGAKGAKGFFAKERRLWDAQSSMSTRKVANLSFRLATFGGGERVVLARDLC